MPAPVEGNCELRDRTGVSPSRLVANLDLGSLVPVLASRGGCNRGLAAAGQASKGGRGESGLRVGVHCGGGVKLSLRDTWHSSTDSCGGPRFTVGDVHEEEASAPAGTLPNMASWQYFHSVLVSP